MPSEAIWWMRIGLITESVAALSYLPAIVPGFFEALQDYLKPRQQKAKQARASFTPRAAENIGIMLLLVSMALFFVGIILMTRQEPPRWFREEAPPWLIWVIFGVVTVLVVVSYYFRPKRRYYLGVAMRIRWLVLSFLIIFSTLFLAFATNRFLHLMALVAFLLGLSFQSVAVW